MQELQQVVESKDQARIQQEAGEIVYPCAEILGSMELVRPFAMFYRDHRKELEVIEASHLMDFANTQTFTSQEFKFYRMGLEAMVRFFESSVQDLDTCILEAEKRNKSVDPVY